MSSIPSELESIVPEPSQPAAVTVALASIQCAVGDQEVTYLTVPVTTGQLFIEWFQSTGKAIHKDPSYASRHATEVILRNMETAKQNALGVRRDWAASVVVNPALLTVEGWRQGDYLRLWLRFICASATRVVASNGWSFSSGCALEITACLLRGIPVFTQDGRPLTLQDARRALDASIEEMVPTGLPLETFERLRGVLAGCTEVAR